MALDDPSHRAMRQLFDRQHAASRNSPMPDAAARRVSLTILHDLVRENADAFAQAIAADFGGRAQRESELLEAIPSLNAIRSGRINIFSPRCATSTSVRSPPGWSPIRTTIDGPATRRIWVLLPCLGSLWILACLCSALIRIGHALPMRDS
jgi:hypothetical protein